MDHAGDAGDRLAREVAGSMQVAVQKGRPSSGELDLGDDLPVGVRRKRLEPVEAGHRVGVPSQGVNRCGAG
jgi:hypothetical protein